ncbi:MAG: alcohol dehydrogenase catalytic domain-containing protein [Candidatus Omnitrophica bacterium]|nr:alcohol dehydrogenase catalytic domain-containing protein [Candidatus Omnitrophota bacterium]MBU4457819.1 alcohol dehydrogenase catalytic domain-containing protein [Candidatus Omnitrophota bacterium]
MRIAMYYANNDVRVEEAPKPKIGDGELLIKVIASGICGTDVVEWYRRDKVPLVLGHEIAGEIAEVGAGVKGYKVGDRISASHHVPCGRCHYCEMDHHSTCETLRKTKFYPGGFAEFLRLPEINIEKEGVYKIPEGVSFEETTFTEPLACAIRGQRLGGYKKGQSLLVIGSGISGLLHIQLAKVKGFGKILATDINEHRLKAALKFGADEAIHAKDLKEEKITDFVILCTGAKSAFEQAFKAVDRAGTILVFASADEGYKYHLPINEFFWRNEVTITSSYAANPEEHLVALELIRDKKINVKDMITHRFGLGDIQKGFDLVASAKESLKVIIEPQK